MYCSAFNLGKLISGFTKGITSAYKAIKPHAKVVGSHIEDFARASAPHVKNALVSGIKAIAPELKEAGVSIGQQALSDAFARKPIKEIALRGVQTGKKSLGRRDLAEKALKGSLAGVSQDYQNAIAKARESARLEKELEGVGELFGEGTRIARPSGSRKRKQTKPKVRR